MLAVAENLLDVDRPSNLVAPLAVQFLTTLGDGIETRTQAQCVTAGIGQAIDMIDTQAIDPPAFDQREQVGMGKIENALVRGPHAHQFSDIEESAPVECVVGGAPIGQPIGLTLQQRMQSRPAFLCGGVMAGEGGRDERIVGPAFFVADCRGPDSFGWQAVPIGVGVGRCQ